VNLGGLSGLETKEKNVKKIMRGGRRAVELTPLIDIDSGVDGTDQ
jgi:hypothetical protein